MAQRRSTKPPRMTNPRIKLDSLSVDDNACTLCHESIELFAIGPCDHPICYKCSTKMRMLCNQVYCAICRADLPKVLFVKVLKKFDAFRLDSFCIYRDKALFFEDESVKSAFDKLLENRCSVCQQDFRSFKELETHLKRLHERHFCELCVEHLKLFSCDRKFYERKQLAEHKRLGDPDDKSYRQHPLCKFCDMRYFDNDELLRHLRKDHFFCHFCESDGLTNEYFQEYKFLQDHFREKHFLCEEDGCADVEFVNAFRSKIDLKAHVSKTHGSNLGRQQARQLRAIDIDFNYGPRPNTTGRRFNDRQRGRGGAGGYEDRLGGRNPSRRTEQRQRDEQEKRMETDAAVALSLSLADAQRQGSVCLMDPQLAQQSMIAQGTSSAAEKMPKTDFKPMSDDFPLLFGKEQSGTAVGKESQSGYPDTMAKFLALGVGHSVGNGKLNEAEFPVLGANKSNRAQAIGGIWNKSVGAPVTSNGIVTTDKLSSKVSKKDGRLDGFSTSGQSSSSSAGFHKSRTVPNFADFPTLGKSSTDISVPSAAWVKSKEKKSLEQPKAKPKQDGFVKLETKKKTEKRPNAEAAAENVTSIESGQINETCERKENVRKEPVKSLADIASLLSGDQNKVKDLNGPASVAALSKSEKTNSHKKQKNGKHDDLFTAKKETNNTEKKVNKENVSDTEKAAAVESKHFDDDPRQRRAQDKVQEKPGKNKQKSKGKGNGSIEAANFKDPEQKSSKIHIPESNVHDLLMPAAAPEASCLPSKDIGGDILTTASSQLEATKSEDMKISDESNGAENQPPTEIRISAGSGEWGSEVVDDDLPKFLPSDFPSLVPINSLSQIVPDSGYGSYDIMPVSTSYSLDQMDIHPVIAGNPLPIDCNIPYAIDTRLSVASDIPHDITSALSSSVAPPPGFPGSVPKPPPGFAPLGQASKPPPGFSRSLISDSDKALNDVNLLNVSSYPPTPSYIPPKQFHERLTKFAEVLNENTGNSFAEFSQLSDEFQGNQLKATDYYAKCSEVMGSSAFQKVFPELVALLPSIEKQQELLNVHRSCLSERSEDVRKGWNPWSLPSDGLIPCLYCGQIVLNDDSLDHLSEHENVYPVLKNCT